jgi:hypothetical protein
LISCLARLGLSLGFCWLGTLGNPHLLNVRCCLLCGFSYLGSTYNRDKGLWLGHVLRLIVMGDMLSQPSTSGASSLLECPVSFINSFCRGLRFALAMQRSSCLGWPSCGLWHLSSLAEFTSSGVLSYYAESCEWIGDWDG